MPSLIYHFAIVSVGLYCYAGISNAADVCVRETTGVLIPDSAMRSVATNHAESLKDCVYQCMTMDTGFACKSAIFAGRSNRCRIFSEPIPEEMLTSVASNTTYVEIVSCVDVNVKSRQAVMRKAKKQKPQVQVLSSNADTENAKSITETEIRRLKDVRSIAISRDKEKVVSFKSVHEDEVPTQLGNGTDNSTEPIWQQEDIPMVESCIDKDPDCGLLSSEGHCEKDSTWLLLNCPFSCNHCIDRAASAQKPSKASNPVPVSGYGDWSSWSPSSCPSTCPRPVKQQRHRKCEGYGGQCSGSATEDKVCSCQAPGWGEWSSWSECSASCGDDGLQSRNRQCASYSGCQDGQSSEQRPCVPAPQPCSQWGSWGSWSQSSVTCVSGNTYGQPGNAGMCERTRNCEPPYGACVGDALQTEPCDYSPPQCAEWNSWGAWSESSITCVSSSQYGQQGNAGKCKRTRTCNPPGGGCQGDESQSQPCDYSPPQCAEWNTWGSWSESTVTCVSKSSYGQQGNAGTCRRTRTCNPPDGNCQGDDSQNQPCNYSPPQCAQWNSWGPWSESAVTCVSKKQYGHQGNAGMCTRTRTCDPAKAYCSGDSSQSQACKYNPPQCAEWNSWGSWSESTVTCVSSKQYGQQGNAGTCKRTRTCSPPGGDCQGDDSQSQPCSYSPPQCAEWNSWGSWSESTITCVSSKTYGQQGNAGTCKRTRTCSPPGGDCQGDDSQSQPCSYSPPQCAEWNSWGSWSESTITCVSSKTYGQQGNAGTCKRTRTCNPQGGDCQGDDSQSQPCSYSPPQCAEWNSWGAWSESSVTCVNANSYGSQGNAGICSRSRTCNPPGGDCQGDDSQSQPCKYSPPQCAEWNSWSSWTESSITCVPAKTYGNPGTAGMCARKRTCEPAGGNCAGDSVQRGPCKQSPPQCAEWDEWGSWSQPSVSCVPTSGGYGSRNALQMCHRTRVCNPSNGGCVGENRQEESCQQSPPPCPSWDDWTSWSECSASCGLGQKQRKRSCKVGQCDGPVEDTSRCSNPACNTGSYVAGSSTFYQSRNTG